jgi:small subunit ribosomal protein S3
MGQKANINSLHLTRNIDWNCVWYSNEKEYPSILIEDITILNYLKSCDVLNKGSEVLKVRICRISKNIVIDIQSTNSLQTDSLSLLKKVVANLKKYFLGFERVFIVSKVLNSNELKVDSVHISKKIAGLIENRVRFKSYLIKNLINQSAEVCKGIKVSCKGRMNGADMASSDFLTVGSIPFQTLKAKINYGFSVANTPKGLMSIKVWVYNK